MAVYGDEGNRVNTYDGLSPRAVSETDDPVQMDSAYENSYHQLEQRIADLEKVSRLLVNRLDGVLRPEFEGGSEDDRTDGIALDNSPLTNGVVRLTNRVEKVAMHLAYNIDRLDI